MSDDQKPWEKNGEEFNEEKAWALIQNLRAESREKSQRLEERDAQLDALGKEKDQLATTVEEQQATLQLAQEDIAKRESDYTQLSNLRMKENLLVDKGLPKNLASYIPDGDEEQMTSAVEEFASLRGQGGTSVPPDPAQVADDAGTSKTDAARAFFGLN